MPPLPRAATHENPLYRLVADLVALLDPGTFYVDVDDDDEGRAVAQVHVANELFWLVSSPGEGRFIIRCEVEDIDPAKDPGLAQRLLELNLGLAGAEGGWLGLAPRSNRVVLAVPARHPMQADELLQALRSIAARVRHWRQTRLRPATGRPAAT
jgi:hypothetical protein